LFSNYHIEDANFQKNITLANIKGLKSNTRLKSSTFLYKFSSIFPGIIYVPEIKMIREYQNPHFELNLGKNCDSSLIICGFILFSGPQISRK